jgi:hypothetical protein
MASKALKFVLIGCGALMIFSIIAIGVAFYFGKAWFTEKVKPLTEAADTEKEYTEKTESLRKEHPFSRPASGIISENQLQRFLEVRKSMYEVYKQHEAEFKKMEKQKEQGFGALMKATDMIQDVKKAQVQAMEKQNMSPEEYSYIVEAVYKSWFAKGAQESMQHETFTEASQENMKKSLEDFDKRIQDPNTSEEERQALIKTKEMMESQWKSVTESDALKQMDEQLQSVPKENIDLFTKYQNEIQQYSMSGLEFLGL